MGHVLTRLMEQMHEVPRCFGSRRGDEANLAPLTRRVRCNDLLEPADKSVVLRPLLAMLLPLRFYNEFCQCLDCRRVYCRQLVRRTVNPPHKNRPKTARSHFAFGRKADNPE